jgi:Flp pilus assembly protein TadG
MNNTSLRDIRVIDNKNSQHGMAALEMALIFPVLMLILLGVYEYGTAFVLNQKAISSSQMMADLIARQITVTDEDIDNVVQAGLETMAPFSESDYAYDVVSIYFNGEVDDVKANICWRRFSGMEPVVNVLTRAAPLANLGEGVVMASVSYVYKPLMGAKLFRPIKVTETAFSRGRRSSVVSLQDGSFIGCRL